MQTNYGQYQAAGQEGMLYDLGFTDKVSKHNPAEVQFGKFVTRVGDDGCKAPAAAADVTDELKALGIVLESKNVVNSVTGNPRYPAKSAVPVLKKGRVWVKSEDQITAGVSTVNVRVGGTGDAGAFRGAADAGNTAVLPKAKWVTSCAAGQLAVLEVDL